MRVTINDIAAQAKVSPSTVSRAIADNPRISAQTRERVLKIMKEMNYHPNMIARSLVSRSTRIIGVIIPGLAEKAFQHPFYPELLRGLGAVAYKNKYKILLATAADLQEEKHAVREFAGGGITEGIIILTSRVKDPSVCELLKMKFPFVVIGRSENSNVNWVDNDNYLIGYQLAEHLIKEGHTKIAFLGVSPDFIVTTDRLHGYKQALADYGLPVDENLIVESKFITDNGYELMKRLLAGGGRPTAVIACDDLLAFGAIKLITEKGMKVPEDIAVVGINNVPLANYFTPTLTSVEINPFYLGSKAFELLKSIIDSEIQSVDRAVIPAKLVVRSSSRKNN